METIGGYNRGGDWGTPPIVGNDGTVTGEAKGSCKASTLVLIINRRRRSSELESVECGLREDEV